MTGNSNEAEGPLVRAWSIAEAPQAFQSLFQDRATGDWIVHVPVQLQDTQIDLFFTHVLSRVRMNDGSLVYLVSRQAERAAAARKRPQAERSKGQAT